MKTNNTEWTETEWDGNPALKLRCFRKRFGRGHVSVGKGDFLTVVFSFGANSDDSHSSTRWQKDAPPMSEAEAMRRIDEQAQLCRAFPGSYRLTLPHGATR